MADKKDSGSKSELLIVPYSKKLTVPSCILTSLSVISLLIAALTSLPLIFLISLALLLASASIIIQNKKITAYDGHVKVRHFLGIIKDVDFIPAECGFFVADNAAFGKKTYIDKRILHRKPLPEEKKYIYISEYILSKQEQEGSQYIFGEPILILDYSEQAYSALSGIFDFNTSPFGSIISGD